MKSFTLILAILLILSFNALAQPDFTVNTAGNPVIPWGASGSWDAGLVLAPNISVVNDTFYMVFGGAINGQSQPMSIGLATSTDGFNFTKSSSNPILSGDGSGFDAYSVVNGPLVYDNGVWYLYYSGVAAAPVIPGETISRAMADNPHGPWTRSNDILLARGSDGSWDDTIVNPVQVLPTDTGLVMYYWGSDEWYPNESIWQIGMATSTDGGQTWQKYNDPATSELLYAESDPVLKADLDESEGFVGASVIKNAGQWEMFYYDISTVNEAGIYYATSPDGIIWEKYSDNPVLTFWDDPLAVYGLFQSPSVVLYNSTYFLYYDYGLGSKSAGIGLATALRLPKVINVPGDFATIQAAINAAIDGDTVLVAEGTYYENVIIESKVVTLASYFLVDGDTSHISKTIINGSQPINTDNASVIMILNTPSPNTICGFTLTGGMGSKKVFPGGYSQIGGGIYSEESSAIIKNNHIINNSIITAPQALGTVGGGIFWGAAVTSGLTLEISGNLISGNEIRGKMSNGGGIIIGNEFVGGELNYLVEDNIIENNTVINTDDWKAMGGGISLGFFLPTEGTQIIRNNIISNNQAVCDNNVSSAHHSFGGGMYIVLRESISSGSEDNDPGPYIYNNLIYRNHTDHLGGGVSVWRTFYIGGPGRPLTSAGNYVPKPSFINNTIVDNTAQDGSGFYIMNDIPFLMNNILWNEHPQNAEWGEIFLGDEPWWLQEVESNKYGGAEIYYTDIQGSWDKGEGNRNEEPSFADAENGDFRLLEGSPGIGWGMDSTIVPKTDFYGNARPHSIDDNADMGAIESPYRLTPTAIDYEINLIPAIFSLNQNFPNPFNPRTVISYQLPVTSHIDLSIYNILGRKVATLVSQKQPAGTFRVQWDASGFASGVYYYRLTTSQGFTQTKKLVLIK